MIDTHSLWRYRFDGISSSIADGNFWRGAKQGVITSGLNHVAHSVVKAIAVKQNFKKKLRSNFEGTGIKPNKRAPQTVESLKFLIEKSATVNSEYTKAGSPNLNNDVVLDPQKHPTRNGKTEILTIRDKNSKIIGFSAGNITLYRNAFKNWFRLGWTFMHESFHYHQLNSGTSFTWFNIGIKNFNYSPAKSYKYMKIRLEIEAWKNINSHYMDSNAYDAINLYNDRLGNL